MRRCYRMLKATQARVQQHGCRAARLKLVRVGCLGAALIAAGACAGSRREQRVSR